MGLMGPNHIDLLNNLDNLHFPKLCRSYCSSCVFLVFLSCSLVKILAVLVLLFCEQE